MKAARIIFFKISMKYYIEDIIMSYRSYGEMPHGTLHLPLKLPGFLIQCLLSPTLDLHIIEKVRNKQTPMEIQGPNKLSTRHLIDSLSYKCKL